MIFIYQKSNFSIDGLQMFSQEGLKRGCKIYGGMWKNVNHDPCDAVTDCHVNADLFQTCYLY